MKKLILLLILFMSVLFTAGCIRDNMNFQGSPKKNAVLEVAQLEQINASLQRGPILLKIGAKWCPHCWFMKPILDKMAAEYSGNAMIGIEHGTYVYMQENGTVSTDRSQARFVGLNETVSPNETTFEKAIDFAILQKEKDKSK